MGKVEGIKTLTGYLLPLNYKKQLSRFGKTSSNPR
jgi:hypothetical protein